MVNIGRLLDMEETRNRSAFGQRMLAARTHARLTQIQVSTALSISQGTLAELERKGEGSTLVVQFAKLYGCSPEWLALGDGEMAGPRVSAEALRYARRLDELRADPPRYKYTRAAIEALLYETPEHLEPPGELEDGTPEPVPAPAPRRPATSKRHPTR